MSKIYGKSCTPNLGGVSDYYTKDELQTMLRDRRGLDINFLEDSHILVGDESDLQRSYLLNPAHFTVDHENESVSVLSATRLSSNRTISLTGDVTGSVVTNLSGNVTIDTDFAQVPLNKLPVGTPRQLLQVNSGGTLAEWSSNIDIPGTLDVTGKARFDSTVQVGQVEPTLPGEMGWNPDYATVDLALNNGVVNPLGQKIQLLCRNDEAVTIAKGKAVMFSGTVGNSGRIKVKLMVANGTYPGYVFLGVTEQSIAAGADGYVVTFGKIRGINTNSYVDGNILWCDPAIPGGFTVTEPQAPNLKLPIAAVVHAANNGTVMVRWDTGKRLSDLHDVESSAPKLDGDLLTWNAGSSRWEAKSPDLLGGQIEFRTTSSHIQWKYDAEDETEWRDLVLLSEITGPAGEAGTSFNVKGTVATEADLLLIESPGTGDAYLVNEDSSLHVWSGTTWVNLGQIKGDPGDDGADGRDIELDKSLTHIQWRYVGDTEWVDLVPLVDITGPEGPEGEKVQLQVNSTHIQWKYETDVSWTNLIALPELKGDQGDPGVGVPTGGATGQILRKVSGTNYDTAWYNAPSGDILGTTDTQSVSNKTLLNYSEGVYTIVDGSSVLLNPNNGPIQTWTLGADRVPNQTGWASGQSITLLIDDGTGFSINWSTNLSVVWKTNSAAQPPLNTTGFTVVVLWKVGSTIYGARVGNA